MGVKVELPYIVGTASDDDIKWKKDWSINCIVGGMKGNDYIDFHKSEYWNELYGFQGNDTIKGGKYWDYIEGGSGNDKLYGNGYTDTIYGGSGNDYIDGGASNDKLYGNTGSDKIKGGGAGDYIEGGSGNDKLYGNNGSDQLYGNSGKDKIYGGSGSDYINGGTGNDTIYGESGRNYIYGDKGNDKIYDGKGRDDIHGGAGNDKIYLKKGKGNTVYTDAGKDAVYVNTTSNTINLGTGKDTIIFNKTNKYNIINFTNSSDYAVLKFVKGKISAVRSGDDIVLKSGKNTVTIKNYTENGHLTVFAGKKKYAIEKLLPAKVMGNAFKSFKATYTAEVIQQQIAWKNSNTNTDMQVLTDTNKTNELPDITAAFVKPNTQI